MNECLVTKLKNKIDENSLPYLGKLEVNLSYVPDSTSSQRFIRIVTNKNVTVTTNAGFAPSNANSTVIVPNHKGDLTVSELKADGTKVVIEDVYSLRYILLGQSKFKLNGFESAFYGDNFKGFYMRMDEFDCSLIKNPSKIEAITINLINGLKISNIDVLDKCVNLKVLSLQNGLNPLMNYNQLLKYSNLRVAVGFGGSIDTLPLNIERFYVISSINTGSINNLISSFVSRGRTSGHVKADWLFASRLVTYNGTPMAEYASNNGLSIQQSCYISWNNNSITFSNTAPEGFQEKDDVDYVIE